MARLQLTEQEREQIRKSLIETRSRRKTQIIKVFELKVNCHQTSKEIKQKMNECFKQAKWIVNDMLATTKQSDEKGSIFNYNYLDHKTVNRFDKNHNCISGEITLPVYLHRGIVQQVKTNIVNLHKAKEHGRKVGQLKFKSEVNSIPIITGGIRIIDNSHITIPGFRKLKIYGLHQILKLPNYELADGKFIKKASGFYIKCTVCLNKDKDYEVTKNKSIGLDFGIKTNITTSDGEKFNCNVRESEYLKYLQKQLHRKAKNSKRYYKLKNQIQKEYEHLTNKKTDACNKLISYLTKNYDMIYFQDEQLSQWKKTKKSKKTNKKCSASFGKNIQCSYLGRLKAKLIGFEGTKSFKIDKFLPTTKMCPSCGCLNTSITLADRVFNCPCGYAMDRDIHAAQNIKLFGSTKRAECLEQASVETLASTISNNTDGKLSHRNENEDSIL